MNELCTDGDIEQLKDAVSIRQEFAEWLIREDKRNQSRYRFSGIYGRG